jgi:hypothetical protein
LKSSIFIVYALFVTFVLVSSSIVNAQTTVMEIQTAGSGGIINRAPIRITEMAEHQNTTVIHIEQEGSGDIIDEAQGITNLNGAMVWNGTAWVVNPTWAHRFFVDTRNGNRLKTYNSLDATVSGLPAGETEVHSDGYGKYYSPQNFGNYSITKQAYWYTKQVASGKGDGSYQYGAVEYRIVDSITGKMVILRSRGVGDDITKAYFDVYIDDDVTDGGIQTTALIGDPIWYTFPLNAVSALSIADLSSYRMGSLPGAVTQQSSNAGDYYLDQGGGSDLGPEGVGKSFELHTTPLVSKFADLSPSYVTGFELKYMDSLGNLSKIVVYPTLFSEKYIPLTSANPSGSPSITMSPSQPTSPSQSAPLSGSMLALIVVIAIIVIILILFLIYKKKKSKKAKDTLTPTAT